MSGDAVNEVTKVSIHGFTHLNQSLLLAKPAGFVEMVFVIGDLRAVHPFRSDDAVALVKYNGVQRASIFIIHPQFRVVSTELVNHQELTAVF